MTNIALAHEALKQYFGYDSFRPMQENIITSILEKKDTLVLMPTGGGKSMCFQIPAMIQEGTAVVVSPLISLMKDQVEGLKANGIVAAYLNSSQTLGVQREIEEEVCKGSVKLLYVSPEKMLNPNFLPLLRQANVSLFAIDEAHCISSWGHDFRPEYTQMKFLKKTFPDIPIVALTATADRVTRKDIAEQLGMVEPQVFISSFDRPNLSLTVKPGQKRFEQIVKFIKVRRHTSGIIYCLSRKNTEKLAEKLRKSGFHAAHYHAGLPDHERNQVQEDFINDKIPIICATIAFGMGIDKSNVRWVIHYNLPKNLEGYYQEIGRAGRDGAKADTLLFYSYNDVSILQDIIKDSSNAQQANLQIAKLERMKQYSEALICRRKILLGYFSEELQKDCGNCDVCNNPPKMFDGTVLAQKALSAVARTKERVGINLLIDILRGSKKREIYERGLDKIRTYGAGADISGADWQYLIQQMINLGLLEIAYHAHHVLRLTPTANAVLFDGKKIELAKMAEVKQRRESSKKEVVDKQRQRVRNKLFETLRALRKELARKKGVPPYIIFSDATLEEMAAEKPTNTVELRAISGVGDVKMQRYGSVFLQAITRFVHEEQASNSPISDQGQKTLQLHKRGYPPTEIAILQKISVVEVYQELANLYAKGQSVNIKSFISKTELKQILQVMETVIPPLNPSKIKSKLPKGIRPEKIYFALAYIERHGEL